MFLGHFGLAFAGKKAAPAVSLGMLVVAAQLADLLWPVLVLAGVERVAIRPGITAVTPLDFQSYPYSHSLVALAAWGLVLGFGYAIVARGGVRAALTLGLLVVSHWVLDVIVHRPDMPVTVGGDTKLGFSLWDSVPGSVALELAVFGICVGVYARITRARDRIGRLAFLGFVAFLLVIYGANVFGPPPPSVPAVAGACMAMWLLAAWAHWLDRHREAA
jgi:hypothetical protein